MMVKVYAPAGVAHVVEIVRVEEPEPVTEAGVKVAVMLAGKLVTLKATLPLKPLRAAIVAV